MKQLQQYPWHTPFLGRKLFKVSIFFRKVVMGEIFCYSSAQLAGAFEYTDCISAVG